MVKHGLYKLWQLISVAICYFLFGLGALIIGLFFWLLSPLPIVSPATKQRWIRWWIHIGSLTFINMLRGFGLLRYTLQLDSMHKEQPGHIIIANHPSLIDAVFLFAANKDVSCLVKSALWQNVFTGAIVRLAGYIPNNTVEAVPLAASKLRKGENLLVFPEGTRSENDQTLSFKRGASNIAVASQAPIVPVLIKCDPHVLKKGDKWYSVPDGGADYLLKSSETLFLRECIDTSKPSTLQYRELTQFLEQYYKDWMAKEATSK